MEKNRYSFHVDITIPTSYPEEQPIYVFGDATFPQAMLEMFDALAVNLLKAVTYKHKQAEEAAKKEGGLSVKTLLEFRHDMKIFKKLADLKELSHDKQFRREKTLLIRSEVELEKHREASSAAIVKENVPKITPMLLPLVLLFEELSGTLPEYECPVCEKLLLPEDPEESLKIELKPELTTCNHWYHYGCLHQYLTSPPFDVEKTCHQCKVVLTHQKWNAEYIRKARKNYEHKMAREREIADVMDVFM